MRTCKTCEKLRGDGTCAVLKVRIGKDQDCWAWSGDPDWEKKVNEAVKAYKGGDFQ